MIHGRIKTAFTKKTVMRGSRGVSGFDSILVLSCLRPICCRVLPPGIPPGLDGFYAWISRLLIVRAVGGTDDEVDMEM